MARTLSLYKRIIEELGLRQLDVYRVPAEKGGFKDVIRLLDPMTNKVALVDLGKLREATDPAEFLEKIIEAATKAEIAIPERKIEQLKEALSSKTEEGKGA